MVADTFTFLDIEGVKNGEMVSSVPNPAVEITRGCLANPRLLRNICIICNVIKQIQVGRTFVLCSKSEFNAYTKGGWNALAKYIKDNGLNQSIRKQVSLLLVKFIVFLFGFIKKNL